MMLVVRGKKIFTVFFLIALVCLSLCGFQPFVYAETVSQAEKDQMLSLVNSVNPTIVTVKLIEIISTSTVDFKQGSGFFISPHGYLVTNWHVVEGNITDLKVDLAEGKELPAVIVAKDPAHDVAVLKVAGDNYSCLKLGNSSKLKIGQKVIAIGNAPGPNDTASVGDIVAFGKKIHGTADNYDESLDNVMQTDSNVIEGNSGGPMIDLAGQVIGINVASVPGASDESFAIPIDDVRTDLAPFVGKNNK